MSDITANVCQVCGGKMVFCKEDQERFHCTKCGFAGYPCLIFIGWKKYIDISSDGKFAIWEDDFRFAGTHTRSYKLLAALEEKVCPPWKQLSIHASESEARTCAREYSKEVTWMNKDWLFVYVSSDGKYAVVYENQLRKYNLYERVPPWIFIKSFFVDGKAEEYVYSLMLASKLSGLKEKYKLWSNDELIHAVLFEKEDYILEVRELIQAELTKRNTSIPNKNPEQL